MDQTDTISTEEEVKPPVTSVGVIGWIRANLFNTWFNSILTVITLYILWKTVPPFIRWALIDSNWYSTAEVSRLKVRYTIIIKATP